MTVFMARLCNINADRSPQTLYCWPRLFSHHILNTDASSPPSPAERTACIGLTFTDFHIVSTEWN